MLKEHEIVKLGEGSCQSEEYCLKSLLHIIQYIGTESGAKVGANICQKSNKPITKHYITQNFVEYECSTNKISLFMRVEFLNWQIFGQINKLCFRSIN